MTIDLAQVAQALVAQGPFQVVTGRDYIELHDPDGLALDIVVFKNDTATWGNFDQYSVQESDPKALATMILLTLKDAV